MKSTLSLMLLALLPAPPAVLAAGKSADRPNILWITSEDTYLNLGCYGDPDAVTPNLDRFSAESVRFTNVFSVHPCCSPSRSCLVTGVYPTRLGAFQHRAKVWTPDEIRCFPSLLRRAGYYCFNGSQGGSAKLDYNFEPNDEPWDRIGSKEVEWRNRKPGQPFFGQINLTCTHQSQYELYARSEKDSPYEMGRDPKRNPVKRLLEAANTANRCDPVAIPRLVELLGDDDSAVRRWGAIGLLTLREKAAPARDALVAALKDPRSRRADDGC